MTGGSATRLAGWNLHGSAGLDVDAVADVLAGQAVDVVCLQEVQAEQAARLARRLGFDHRRWWFKHWPVVKAPEGLAVLSRHPFEGSPRRLALRGALPWSHRRRIAGHVRLRAPGGPLDVWVSHLSSGQDRDARLAEARDLIAQMSTERTVLAADLNARPGSRTVALFEAAGYRDTLAGDDVSAAAVTTDPSDRTTTTDTSAPTDSTDSTDS